MLQKGWWTITARFLATRTCTSLMALLCRHQLDLIPRAPSARLQSELQISCPSDSAGIQEGGRKMAKSNRHATLKVSELMMGYITLGDTEILSGYKNGLFAGTYIETQLTITSDDMKRFVSDPAHSALPSGLVKCPILGGDMAIEGGEFELFVNTENNFLRRMNYRLFFTGTKGPMTL